MRKPRVPILMYHGLYAGAEGPPRVAASEERYWIPVDEFQQQVSTLAGRGYRTVPLSALLPGAGPTSIPRPLVITFDDGHASDHQLAMPVLRNIGWRSEHFLVPARIGTSGVLSWSHVEALDRAGMGIQSHTMTHPDLDQLSPNELRRELSLSRRALRERVNAPVDFLALPGGTGRRAHIAALALDVGYQGVCTSAVGLNEPGRDPFALRRIPVTRGISPRRLLEWVAGKGLVTFALRGHSLRAIRRLLGPRHYEHWKERLLSLHGARVGRAS